MGCLLFPIFVTAAAMRMESCCGILCSPYRLCHKNKTWKPEQLPLPMEDSWMLFFFNLLYTQYCDWRVIPVGIPPPSLKLLDLYRGVEKCQIIKWQNTVKGKGSEIYCSLLLQVWDFSHFQPTEAKVAELKAYQDMRILDQLW